MVNALPCHTPSAQVPWCARNAWSFSIWRPEASAHSRSKERQLTPGLGDSSQAPELIGFSEGGRRMRNYPQPCWRRQALTVNNFLSIQLLAMSEPGLGLNPAYLLSDCVNLGKSNLQSLGFLSLKPQELLSGF